jgi:hypothetical protein
MTIQLTLYSSPGRPDVRVVPLPLAVPACQPRPRLRRHVDPHVDQRGARRLRRTLDGVLGAALMVAVAFVGAAMAGSEALRLAASL